MHSHRLSSSSSSRMASGLTLLTLSAFQYLSLLLKFGEPHQVYFGVLGWREVCGWSGINLCVCVCVVVSDCPNLSTFHFLF